jgi:hypothetical protein
MRRHHLDRNGAMEACVAGAIDLAHSARTERAQDLVRAESRPDVQRHRTCEGMGDARSVRHDALSGRAKAALRLTITWRILGERLLLQTRIEELRGTRAGGKRSRLPPGRRTLRG